MIELEEKGKEEERKQLKKKKIKKYQRIGAYEYGVWSTS